MRQKKNECDVRFWLFSHDKLYLDSILYSTIHKSWSLSRLFLFDDLKLGILENLFIL